MTSHPTVALPRPLPACLHARLPACLAMPCPALPGKRAGRLAGRQGRATCNSSLRRSDQVVFVGAETLMLEDSSRAGRTCARAQFSKTLVNKNAGASTRSGHFVVTIGNPGQSGSITSGRWISAANPLQFKQDRRGAEI